MKNKQVKQMMIDCYRHSYSKYTDSYYKEKNEWSFDRLRLFEGNWNRTKLRHKSYSKVSLTAKQLKN